MTRTHLADRVRATRTALRRRAGAVAALTLGSALAGAAGTAHHLTDAAPAAANVTAPASDGVSTLGIGIVLHSEERRAVLADGGARLHRVRTLHFMWRTR